MSAAAPPSYSETIDAVKAACALINLSYGDGSVDGRIVSAIKETEYLAALKTSLEASHPAFTISIPKERYWYDIRINNIPINLKLTTGGTDNAFNKVAILYSITGVEVRRNMNFDAWYGLIRSTPPKVSRDKATEYHYLAVHKTTGAVILKSIFDIHTYKANPCNDLQISWRNEFANADYVCPSHHAKTQELLRTVQASVLAAHASARLFAGADFGPGTVTVTADD